MKIKELESKKSEEMLSFKDFYKYFKTAKYNTTLKAIKEMYRVYIR